jgi:hypothetical protein
VEVSATSAGSVDRGGSPGVLLSVEGVRRLRRLLTAGAAGGDGSGT